MQQARGELWRCPCASPKVALCGRPAQLGSHTGLYLQSHHSPGLCLAARFLCSVLISQGASFGLIIPTGINRTAAAIPASAASFAEQQCGLLDKAGAGSQEHGKARSTEKPAQLLPGATTEDLVDCPPPPSTGDEPHREQGEPSRPRCPAGPSALEELKPQGNTLTPHSIALGLTHEHVSPLRAASAPIKLQGKN